MMPGGTCGDSVRQDDFSIRFWGVRGSIASPGPETVRYGGNTSCIEVRCGDSLLILDAGTGLRPLGRHLLANGRVELDLFLTHTHLDHVEGLPFFQPAFDPRNVIRIWAGHLTPNGTLIDVFRKLMSPPLFPIPPDAFRAKVEFRDFECGEVMHPRPGVRMATVALDHPGGAVGYRVEYDGRAVCYVSDTNHPGDGRVNPEIRDLVAGAEIVVYDAMFTDEEHAQRPDWGHSTWREGARLCEEAGAGTLVLWHHDPIRSDDALDAIGAEADAARPGTLVAREGLILHP